MGQRTPGHEGGRHMQPSLHNVKSIDAIVPSQQATTLSAPQEACKAVRRHLVSAHMDLPGAHLMLSPSSDVSLYCACSPASSLSCGTLSDSAEAGAALCTSPGDCCCCCAPMPAPRVGLLAGSASRPSAMADSPAMDAT